MFNKNPAAKPFQHFGGRDFTPTDSSDIILTIVPKHPPSLIRIFIAFSAAGKLYADVTREGAAWTFCFNTNVNLTAGCIYAFDILASTLDTSIVLNSDTADLRIGNLTVQEIFVGGQ